MRTISDKTLLKLIVENKIQGGKNAMLSMWK